MSDFEPRQAEPGQQFTVTQADGSQVEFAADDAGNITPENVEQAAALDAMGVLSKTQRKALEKGISVAGEAPAEESDSAEGSSSKTAKGGK